MGMAGMEDARVKSGNGLVDRGLSGRVQSTSVKDYFKGKRMITPGTEEYKELQTMRQKQTGLREMLDAKVTRLIQEDMRYR
jgi:hypothetical protein